MNCIEIEIELLKELYQAKLNGINIGFYENEPEKLKMYQEKYGDADRTLLDKGLISGKIEMLCPIKITKEGEIEIRKILEEETKQEEKQKYKVKNKIEYWKLILMIIAALIALISLIMRLQ